MIGSIIGAGLKGIGSIFGGIAAARSARRLKRNINNQLKDNQDWFNRKYNEDATQRADAQRILAMTEESIRNRNRQAAGVQAVMGGTDESVQAAKEANADALAQVSSSIAADAEQRKDAIEQQYMERKNELQGQLNEIEQNKAKSISGAVSGLSDIGASVAENWKDWKNK